MMLWEILLLLFAVLDVIAFALYGIDKHRAKRNLWRIPESTLLLTGFFGGAFGALLAMKLFRHKTKHWYFWAINIAALVLHAAALILLYFYKIKLG